MLADTASRRSGRPAAATITSRRASVGQNPERPDFVQGRGLAAHDLPEEGRPHAHVPRPPVDGYEDESRRPGESIHTVRQPL